MISKQQWETMTPQQQFDYVRLLEDTVDSVLIDAAMDAEDETQPVVAVSA